jgi:hypothetical protein
MQTTIDAVFDGTMLRLATNTDTYLVAPHWFAR